MAKKSMINFFLFNHVRITNASQHISNWIRHTHINNLLPTCFSGMDIAITTTAQNDDDAKKLLAMFNFPFKGQENVSYHLMHYPDPY
jgi:hypothetical protein